MAKKPAAKKNARRGTVKKPAKDKPAVVKPGRAAGSKSFDAGEVCEELKLYWPQDGGDSFVLQSDEELWSMWPMTSVKKLARNLPGRWIGMDPREGERLSEMDRVLLHARQKRCIEEVIPALAGYRAGIHTLKDGTSVLVRISPRYIEPVQGEWPVIKALIDGRLNLLPDHGDIDQTVYYHAYHKVAYESVMYGKPGSFKPGHILVLAGPVNSAKSRLQEMITTPLLGGRDGDPTPFLMGDDNFNKDLVGASHWKMEELQSSSWGAADKVKLSEAMKRAAVNESKRMRLMRTDPRTVQPFVRVTLSMNDDPDKMRAFPMLTPDFADKVLMLKVALRELPMPTETIQEQEAFNTTVRAELPAYAWWLMNEFQIPEILKVDAAGKRATRFGFASYQHPSLASQLSDDSPSAQLLRLVDQAMFEHATTAPMKLWDLKHPMNTSGHKTKGGPWVNAEGVWRGRAEDLEDLLCGHTDGWTSTVARAASRLLGKSGASTMLSRLAADRVDRVSKGDTGRERGWFVGAPAAE